MEHIERAQGDDNLQAKMIAIAIVSTTIAATAIEVIELKPIEDFLLAQQLEQEVDMFSI